MTTLPGTLFRTALQDESPLQLVGVTNPYHAVMAKAAGFRSIYLSGSGVATASYGLPDLGMTTLDNVLEDVRRITSVTELPLLVDVDTGWGGAFMIARTMKEMARAGAAGVHIEDQVQAKRCGHRPGKQIVSTTEMCDRVKAATDARGYDAFVLMARTDAIANDGVDSAIERSVAYVEAGADMIFAEAVSNLEDFQKFKAALSVPILANLTEFGQTPAFTVDELRGVSVDIALYPLTAFRAANRAAEKTFNEIRTKGTQTGVVNDLQTRAELYEYLDYHKYESKLDELFESESND
ncbi:MAG TPA: methylisocitrate lyase [Dehalococcoidia bacterium]|nr:methylisocitrate lyase [Chloroflexota bacterium]HCI85462.1 methylisocitrate lyase [Dehalococcoidia bacterium]|tara:strand:+ start:24871 stop:25755 length:885 start_codon:yes stop_codon:yes gene_type:complete